MIKAIPFSRGETITINLVGKIRNWRKDLLRPTSSNRPHESKSHRCSSEDKRQSRKKDVQKFQRKKTATFCSERRKNKRSSSDVRCVIVVIEKKVVRTETVIVLCAASRRRAEDCRKTCLVVTDCPKLSYEEASLPLWSFRHWVAATETLKPPPQNELTLHSPRKVGFLSNFSLFVCFIRFLSTFVLLVVG